VNLWTVGCADPRLTAPARSPMDKPGKTPCVSPTLPTGRRLPTSFTAPPQQLGLNLIPGKVKPSAGLPALAQLRLFEHFNTPKCLRFLRPTSEGRHYSGIGGTGPAVILGGG
jgi:hypothetical protein